MPIKPDHVSGVRGPLMNVTAVDDKTVDVVMTTSFRRTSPADIAAGAGAGGGGNRLELPAPGSVGDGAGAGAGRIREIGDGGSRESTRSAVPTRWANAHAVARAGAYRDTGRFAIASPDDYVQSGGSGDLAVAEELRAEPRAGGWRRRALLNTMGSGRWRRMFSSTSAAVGGFARFSGDVERTIVAVKQLLERGQDVVTRLGEAVVLSGRHRTCCLHGVVRTLRSSRRSLRASRFPAQHPAQERRAAGGSADAPRGAVRGQGMWYPTAVAAHPPPRPQVSQHPGGRQVAGEDRGLWLSRVRRNILSGRSNIHGTFEWMAPEMLRAENFDEKADVYSYQSSCGAPLRADAVEQLINVQVVAVVGYDRQRLVLGLAAEEARGRTRRRGRR